MPSKDFVLELEENATDSLTHAVSHYLDESEPTYLKYAVMHSFHAVELFLKARLAKEHPLLVYDAPEKAPTKPGDDYRTVDFQRLVERLQKSGVTISKDDVSTLNQLRRVRNAIEHHRVEMNSAEVEEYLGRAMFFLDGFLREELGIELETQLGDKAYTILKQAMFTFEEQMKLAERSMQADLPRKFKDQLEYTRELCSACGNETVLAAPSLGEAVCHHCRTKFYVKQCERCGTPELSTHPFTADDDDVCEYCWNQVLNE